MSLQLRQRRARAARAMAQHSRRGQLGWDDLAAWPDWADGIGGAEDVHASQRDRLAARCAAVWHAGALRRCIHGPTLQRLRQSLGDDTMLAVLAAHGTSDDGGTTPLPPPEYIETWLHAQGAEVMLAALPSPLLRLALRERLWPQALPPLPAPDSTSAAQALQIALQLTPKVLATEAGA